MGYFPKSQLTGKKEGAIFFLVRREEEDLRAQVHLTGKKKTGKEKRKDKLIWSSAQVGVRGRNERESVGKKKGGWEQILRGKSLRDSMSERRARRIYSSGEKGLVGKKKEVRVIIKNQPH